MSRLLIISDTHHRFARVQSLMDTIHHDKAILLGDYFDAFGDTAEDARNTAIWLKEKVLYNPKIIALVGNHDSSYVWRNNPHLRCSGYGNLKNTAINDILIEADKAKFNVYHIDQNFLFSHAGITNPVYKEMELYYPERDAATTKTKLEFLDEMLRYYIEKNVTLLTMNRPAPLFAAGWDRGGMARHGGITWVDWNSFAPVSGVNQMIGHTTGRLPRILVQKQGGGYSKKTIIDHYNQIEDHPEKDYLSISYALDTGLNHYAIIEDGKVNFFDFFNHVNLRDVKKFNIPESSMNNLS